MTSQKEINLVPTHYIDDGKFAGWQDSENIDGECIASQSKVWMTELMTIEIGSVQPTDDSKLLEKLSDSQFIFNNGWVPYSEIPNGTSPDGKGGWIKHSDLMNIGGNGGGSLGSEDNQSSLIDMLSESSTLRKEIPVLSAIHTIKNTDKAIIDCWIKSMNDKSVSSDDYRNTQDMCGLGSMTNKRKAISVTNHYGLFSKNDLKTESALSDAIVRIRDGEKEPFQVVKI